MASVSEIIKSRTFYDSCAQELFQFYKGDSEELKSTVFPKPPYLILEDYNILMGFFVYVNLCKPSVNRIVSGVYGNPVKRTVESGSQSKSQVDAFLEESKGYSLRCREWFKSAVLYGTGIQVFTLVSDGENDPVVTSWLANPIRTEIITNAEDVTDVEMIIEEIGSPCIGSIPRHAITEDQKKKRLYRFATKEMWGTANESGEIVSAVMHGLGIVPAVICYGEDTRMYGEVRGRSLVKSAPQFSTVVSRLLLNQVALIMNYVRPQAVASGEVKNENTEEAFEAKGVLEMSADGKFMFVTPDTNFQDLTKTIDSYKANYCISEGVPLDALDPANMPENQSATSARLRNQPMSVTINRLVEEQKTNEVRALTIVAALYQMIETQEPVTFSDVSRRFNCSVQIEPAGSPESLSELAAAWAQLIALGAKTTEDAIRFFNTTAGESEIKRRVNKAEAMKKQVSQGDPAKNEPASGDPKTEKQRK